MARNLYGCTSADFTLTAGGRLSPGAVLTLWTARTGGTRITDLLTVDGTPITEVVSGGDASIAYQGPDNDKSVHWADSGQGARTAIRPVDITGAVGPTGGVGPIGPPGASVGVLTTKGDLLVRDSGAGVRLPVGADGTMLQADAGSAAGVRWSPTKALSGTGAPGGVIAAAPGSTYLQTDATNDVKGWIKWVKATGTGSTGWVAGPEADTGERLIAPTLSNGWTTYADVCFLRRVGNQVTLTVYLNGGAASAAAVWSVASGYRPAINCPFVAIPNGNSRIGLGLAETNGNVSVIYYTADIYYVSVRWHTNDPWPTSLPGSAV